MTGKISSKQILCKFSLSPNQLDYYKLTIRDETKFDKMIAGTTRNRQKKITDGRVIAIRSIVADLAPERRRSCSTHSKATWPAA